MFQIGTFAVSWECSCSVPLLGKFGEILGTLQAHARKTAKLGTFEMCLQCPQNFPKFYKKQYTAGTLPDNANVLIWNIFSTLLWFFQNFQAWYTVITLMGTLQS